MGFANQCNHLPCVTNRCAWLIDPCMISGFCRELDENCTLLGYYAASSDSFFPIFRDIISVPSSRLKMGRIEFSKNSVRNYHYLLRNNPEERKSDLLLFWSLILTSSVCLSPKTTKRFIPNLIGVNWHRFMPFIIFDCFIKPNFIIPLLRSLINSMCKTCDRFR